MFKTRTINKRKALQGGFTDIEDKPIESVSGDFAYLGEKGNTANFVYVKLNGASSFVKDGGQLLEMFWLGRTLYGFNGSSYFKKTFNSLGSQWTIIDSIEYTTAKYKASLEQIIPKSNTAKFLVIGGLALGGIILWKKFKKKAA